MHNVRAGIIRALFPNITKSKARRLASLACDKKVVWLDSQLESNLRGIYASMVRHEDTHYDAIVGILCKKMARKIVKMTIERGLAKAQEVK